MAAPRVLFVDDEETIVRNAKTLLESHGFSVCTYSSANQALKSDLSDIACFVIDWDLPEISGIDLYKKIQERAGPQPVIFISGYDLTTDYPFLKKPFRFSTLADFIHKQIRSPS